MIVSRAPLRIELFGSGTDLPCFSKKEFGCTINVAIDKYVYVVAHPSFYRDIILSYSIREETDHVENIKNTRIKEVMKKVGINKGIEIHSLSEVPKGTGLGSSSSFTVSLFNLLYAYRGKFVPKKILAEDACEVEIDILKEPIGKQDQYAAAFGGFNFTKFNTDGSVEIEPIRISNNALEEIRKRLVVFYTGKTRDSSTILKDQNEQVIQNPEQFEIMKKMKEIALKMREELNNNKIENFGKCLNESWELKKKIMDGISNPEIEKICKMGLDAGASGVNLSGAGGGGFIIFYCEPNNQDFLRKELRDLIELSINFDREGAKILHA